MYRLQCMYVERVGDLLSRGGSTTSHNNTTCRSALCHACRPRLMQYFDGCITITAASTAVHVKAGYDSYWSNTWAGIGWKWTNVRAAAVQCWLMMLCRVCRRVLQLLTPFTTKVERQPFSLLSATTALTCKSRHIARVHHSFEQIIPSACRNKFTKNYKHELRIKNWNSWIKSYQTWSDLGENRSLTSQRRC